MSFKLVNYKCPTCGLVKEDFEGEDVMCDDAHNFPANIQFAGTRIVSAGTNMEKIFSPKNNSQRAKVND